jgi:putative PIN family toxin of toxin-antitoxin system
MIRVVLDANVLAPGFATRARTTSAAQLIDMWQRKEYELVVSDHLLMELANTLAEPYFQKLFPQDDVHDLLLFLRREALVTELSAIVKGVATQPEDDLVLATGVSAGASYLATRDRQLLKIGFYQRLHILHPADLVDLLIQGRDPFDET